MFVIRHLGIHTENKVIFRFSDEPLDAQQAVKELNSGGLFVHLDINKKDQLQIRYLILKIYK